MVKYEILGPIRVTDEHGSSFVSARKIEILLLVLLIRAGQVVTSDQLMNEIWGSQVPRQATAGLYVYVSQLRKFLDRPGRPESPIITRHSGYLLHLGADELDLNSFQRMVAAGREYAREGRHGEASSCFERALAIWRGPVSDNLRVGPIVDGFVPWLHELRMECLEMLIDSQLQLGLHREYVGSLYSLIAEHPFREAFYRQLMLALYRSECRADALKVYQVARRVLNEELGLEPGRALQKLQQAILVADDYLDPDAAV